MYPLELKANRNTQNVSESDRNSAVLFTGGGLRHLRFGYLVQASFPGLIRAWYETAPNQPSPEDNASKALNRMIRPFGATTPLTMGELVKKVFQKGIKKSLLFAADRVHNQLLSLNYPKQEKEMFGWEVEILSKNARIHPETIKSPNSDASISKLQEINPYLILTFGGPLLSGKLLQTARGYAINQHAGYAPDLKGANTTEMALFFRRIDRIASTVHIMDTHADAGPILRRSLATIHTDDGAGNCFLSVTALGNHLMIEAIEHILRNDSFDSFEQDIGTGQTILSSDLSTYRKRLIKKSQSAMLKAELRNLRDF